MSLKAQGQAGCSGVYEFIRHDVRGLRGSGPLGEITFEDLWERSSGSWKPRFPERIVQRFSVKNKFLRRGLAHMMSRALYDRVDGTYLGPSEVTYQGYTSPFGAFILCGDAPGYPADAMVTWDESDGQYNAKIPPGSLSAAGVGKRGLLLSKTSGPGIKRQSVAWVSSTPYRELEYVFFAQANTPTYSTGTITAVAGSSLTDADYFTIQDGFGTYIFEFDSDGSVTSGRIGVRYTSGDTATQVRDSIIYAINKTTDLLVTASAGSGAVVNLTHDVGGTIGNKSVTENVANAGFTVTGLTGGSDSGLETADDGVDNLSIKSVGIAATVAAGNGESGSLWAIRAILGLAPTFQGKNQRTFIHGGTNLHKYLTNETVGVYGDGYVQSSNQEQTIRSISSNTRDRIIASAKYVEMANGSFTADDIGRSFDITGSSGGNNGRWTIASVISATEVLMTTTLVGNEGSGFSGAVVEACEGSAAFDGRLTSEGDSTDPKFGEVYLGGKWRSVTSAGPHMIGRVWGTARVVTGVRLFITPGGNINNVPDQFIIQYLPNGGSGTRPVDDTWVTVPGEDFSGGGMASNIYNAGTYGYSRVFSSPTPPCLGIRLSAVRAYSSSDFVELGEMGIFSDTEGVTLSGDKLIAKVGSGSFKTFVLPDCSGVTNMQTLADNINSVVRGYGFEAVVSSLGYLWFRGTVGGGNSTITLDTVANGSTANIKLGFPDGGTKTGVTKPILKYPLDALTVIYRVNVSGDLP